MLGCTIPAGGHLAHAADIEPALKGGLFQDFEWVVALPLTHSSSVIRGSTDAVVSPKPDVHAAPEIAIKWAHQFDHLKLSASIGIVADRYIALSAASESTIVGNVTVALTEGRSDRLVPFLSATVFDNFDFALRHHAITMIDTAVGVFSGIGWRQGQWLEFSHAREPGDIGAIVNARVGSRIADIHDFDNRFAQVSGELRYTWMPTVVASANARVTVRSFDDFFGDARRDTLVGAGVKLAWTPDWLTRTLPQGELGFAAFVQKNTSTFAGAGFRDVSFGPSLILASKF